MNAHPQAQRVHWQADGRAQVRTGKVEIGQGIRTAMAQIAADALGVPMAQIELAPVSTDHSPDDGVTSGSLSVQQAGLALRQACLALRSGALAAPAACGPTDGSVLGQSVPRLDLPTKLRGGGFIHDLKPADAPLLHGRVLHPPRLAARLLGFNAAAVETLPGVVRVLHSGNLLGVVAMRSAQADAACAALQASVRWQVPPDAAEEADDLQQLPSTVRSVTAPGLEAAAAAAGHDETTPLRAGEQHALARTLGARYTKPWIAHASIAPSCALALWAHGRLLVDTHSQGIFNLRRDLALAFALEEASVCVQHQDGAGCYGHNGADDVAFDAAWLAQSVPGQRVRVLWNRADELSHAPFGPAMVMELQATVDAQGHITRWRHDLWSPGHSRRPGRDAVPALLGAWQVAGAPAPTPSIDMPLASGGGAERNAVPGYDVPDVQVHCHSVRTQRRSSALRSLGAFGNVFAIESFMDEIAQATGACPLALRRQHLQHDPRALAVLEAAAARSGYAHRRQQALAPGQRQEGLGCGLAMARYKGTGAWCAVVAEVQAGAQLMVTRLSIAADLGLVVNPDGAAHQLEGGAIQATSWALKEAARPAHEGWADYPILRFSEVPAVDVLLMASAQPSLGAGEASMGPTAAAIANALFDALGLRVRSLPLTPERIIAAMHAPDLEKETP